MKRAGVGHSSMYVHISMCCGNMAMNDKLCRLSKSTQRIILHHCRISHHCRKIDATVATVATVAPSATVATV